jgi:ribosomal-protein-alanine N-acetyltransferase
LYEAKRVALRRITIEDEEEFIALARASVELHRPWITIPETSSAFSKYLDYYGGSEAECALICSRESGAIAGFITINDITRGAYQRATVGYGVFAPSARLGYMSEGFGLLFRFAFADLGLHRLEADIQPGNSASISLAKRVGFRYEGFSPGFIRIDGSWKDHERWAVTSDMVMPG